MGALLSLGGTNGRVSNYCQVSQNENCKRKKLSSTTEIDNSRLIPTLPDEISLQILARLPRICYFSVRLVARNWKAAVMSHELFHLRTGLGVTEEWLYVLTKVEDDQLLWHALDPLSRKWQRLPPMPNFVQHGESRKGFTGLWMWNMVEPSNKIAELVKTWLGWKDTLDQMPFCGCAIAGIDGCLYVLGGFSRASAMACVWRFDPILNMWDEVAPMSTGRAYCKTAILNKKLYVVGGVSRGRAGLTPLQSAEVFDPHSGVWALVPSMPCSRALVLPTAFLSDMLKPIATGMTSYMGRLCVPQSLYYSPFFVDVRGEIYDPETNSWVEMPTGMGEGWPARQAGTKFSVVVDGELYAFDPSSSLDGGEIKVYDQNEDVWKVVTGRLPIYDLSDSPYLLTGFHGKLHVITKDANHRIAVLQADLHDHSGPIPSNKHSDSLAETETVIWKAIASRDFGCAELLSCQALDI